MMVIVVVVFVTVTRLEIPNIPTRPGISPEFLLQCAGNPRYIYIPGYESFSDDDCLGAFPKEMEQ